MGNLNIGDVTQVIVGPAKFMVAPEGTTLPSFSGDTVTWPTGWWNPGYTEDGLTFGYAPTAVEIKVDEEANPIDELLDAEKITLAIKLAQGTLANMQLAISGATITTSPASPASPSDVEVETLTAGGGQLRAYMVGFEGQSDKKDANGKRLPTFFVGYRARVKSNVSTQFKRTSKMVIPVEFGLLADSTKPAGENAFKWVYKKKSSS